jgi:hypothetical protein
MCSDGDVTAPERKTSNSGSDPPLLQSPGAVCVGVCRCVSVCVGVSRCESVCVGVCRCVSV